MANTMDKQPRNVALWNGRPVVVLNESLDHSTHFHGVMIGPKGLGVEEALHRLDRAFHDAVEREGEEWNYDHVLEAMKAAGFDEIKAAVWDECHAPMPDLPHNEMGVRKGDKIAVRDNATGQWHLATFAGMGVTHDDGPAVYNLTDCPFKWAHREDLSLNYIVAWVAKPGEDEATVDLVGLRLWFDQLVERHGPAAVEIVWDMVNDGKAKLGLGKDAVTYRLNAKQVLLTELAAQYTRLSHGPTCTSRHGAGECDCFKQALAQMLTENGQKIG